MSTTTPNMSLKVPSVNDADYPASISTSLTAVDLHDHAAGKGVQVDTAGLKNGAVTPAKRSAGVEAVSASCGAFTTDSPVPVDVTNLSVTIACTGRRIVVALNPDNAPAGDSKLSGYTDDGHEIGATFAIVEGATTIARVALGSGALGATGPVNIDIPPSALSKSLVPTAGNHTYKVEATMTFSSGSNPYVGVTNCHLVAYEL